MSPENSRPTALVTGATAGIGEKFAERLAARGHNLILVARNQERLGEVATRLGSAYHVDTEVLSADLVDRAALAQVEARLADPDRPVDLLVNNAGFGLKKNFLDNTIEQEQAQLDILVVAMLRLSHAALLAMAARGSGRIINVSSVSAYLPRGTYGAAKAYVTRFSQWADAEYADRGVRVMVLTPGFVRTEFHQRMDVSQDSAPSYLWLDADTVVDQALADLDAGKTVSIPTRRYQAIVAATRLVPTSLLQRMQSFGRR